MYAAAAMVHYDANTGEFYDEDGGQEGRHVGQGEPPPSHGGRGGGKGGGRGGGKGGGKGGGPQSAAAEARQREQRKRNEGKYRKAQAARKEGVR